MSFTPEVAINPVVPSGEALVDTYRELALAGIEATEASESARILGLETKSTLIDPETSLPLETVLSPEELLQFGQTSARRIIEKARADSLAKRREDLRADLGRTVMDHYYNRVVAIEAVNPGSTPISRMKISGLDRALATHSVMDKVVGRVHYIVDERYLMLLGRRSSKYYEAQIVDPQADRLVTITLL